MNWHTEGDLLEEALIEELRSRWIGCRVIETKYDSVHGIDFAIELPGAGVGIIESKSKTGSVKNPQMSKQWIRERINSELQKAIIRAVKADRPIFFATYRTSRILDQNKKTVSFKVKSASPNGELKWEDLFPNLPVPSKDVWKLFHTISSKQDDNLLITHEYRNASSKQVHEYKILICSISKAIYDSTLKFNTFPFDVNHSHRIIENGKVIYDRTIEQWSRHKEQKGSFDFTPIKIKNCGTCGIRFFDTSSFDVCFNCFDNEVKFSLEKAKELCLKTKRLRGSSDWKNTTKLMSDLQKEWKSLKNFTFNESELLWNNFNANVQYFFERRNTHFQKQSQERINNKSKAERLISEASRLSQSEDWKNTAEQMKTLQKKWKSVNPLPNEESDRLWNSFNEYIQKFFVRRSQYFEKLDQQRVKNKSKAERLISDASRLSQSEDWKNTTEQMKTLQEKWKSVNPLPHKESDRLWNSFNGYIQKFFDRRSQFFKELDQQRVNNRSKAERLISEASRLSQSEDWKNTAEQMKTLQKKWKSVNPLPHEESDRLWNSFNGYIQKFFDRRSQFFEQLDQQRINNRSKAERLISEANRLSRSEDWKYTTEQMKSLQREWKYVNPLPKDDSDRLWNQFNQNIQDFFDNKNAHYEQKNREWVSNIKNAIKKAIDAKNNILLSIEHDKGLIDNWHDTINNLHPGKREPEIRAALEEKINAVEEKVTSKTYKIKDIEESIYDMKSKLSKN